MTASYAGVQDLRTYGITPTQAADLLAVDRLEVASRIVDDYCGVTQFLPGFYATQSLLQYVTQDIRNPLLVLPRPFSMLMPSPTAPSVTVVGTPGTTTYEYQVVATNANGDTIPGPVGYTQTGNATLNGSNKNTIAWTAVPDATSYKVLLVGPSTLPTSRVGSIGTTAALTLDDTGQLATPYSANVTSNPAMENAAVTVNGRSIASTAWTVEPWGLRLYVAGYLDADGYPRRTATDIGYGQRGYGGPYGSQVSVTALFGYATAPTPVRQATVLIAAYLLGQQGNLPIDRRIARLQTEGYMVMYDDKGQDELLITTGVADADKLLLPYRQSAMYVG